MRPTKAKWTELRCSAAMSQAIGNRVEALFKLAAANRTFRVLVEKPPTVATSRSDEDNRGNLMGPSYFGPVGLNFPSDEAPSSALADP